MFFHLGRAFAERQDAIDRFALFKLLDKSRMELKWRGPVFTTPDGERYFMAFGPIDYLRYLMYLLTH